MVKLLLKIVTYKFLYLFLSLQIFGKLTLPSINDSILADKKIKIQFESNNFSIHSLHFSSDGGMNFSPIVDMTDSSDLLWSPPKGDYDSIIFRYSSIEFHPPQLKYRIANAHFAEVTSISFSPDSSVFATGSLDGKISVFRTLDGRRIDLLDIYPKKILKVLFVLGSDNIFFTADSSLFFWNRTFRIVQRIYNANGLLRAFDYNSNGIIALGSYDSTFVVLNLRFIRLIHFRNDAEIYSTAISSDGRFVAFGDYHGKVKIFELSSGRLVMSINTNKSQALRNVVWTLNFSDDNKHLVTGGIDGLVNIWDVSIGGLLYSTPTHNFHIRGIQLHNNLPIVLSVSLDSTIKQIFYPVSKQIHPPIHENSQIVSLAITKGKSIFAVGFRNGEIAVYSNFRMTRDTAIQSNRYFIPIKVKSRYILAKAGEVTFLPIILKNPLNIELVNFKNDSSTATLFYPNKFFVVFENDLKGYNADGVIKILSSLKNIHSIDTFAVVKIWVMDNDSAKAYFWIDSIDFRGKTNLLWNIEIDSIEIYENCPTIGALTKFEIDRGVDFEYFPNPTTGDLIIKVFSTLSIAEISIELSDIVGKGKLKLFKGNVSKGVNFINFDLSNVSVGTYFLILKLNDKTLAKKLLISR